MANIYDLMVLIDVTCTDCGKLISMANAYSYEFRYLCPTCAKEIEKEIDELYGLEFGN